MTTTVQDCCGLTFSRAVVPPGDPFCGVESGRDVWVADHLVDIDGECIRLSGVLTQDQITGRTKVEVLNCASACYLIGALARNPADGKERFTVEVPVFGTPCFGLNPWPVVTVILPRVFTNVCEGTRWCQDVGDYVPIDCEPAELCEGWEIANIALSGCYDLDSIRRVSYSAFNASGMNFGGVYFEYDTSTGAVTIVVRPSASFVRWCRSSPSILIFGYFINGWIGLLENTDLDILESPFSFAVPFGEAYTQYGGYPRPSVIAGDARVFSTDAPPTNITVNTYAHRWTGRITGCPSWDPCGCQSNLPE